MGDEARFLWFSRQAPPRGFREVPQAGFCVSAFLFVVQGQEVLLGRYADDPRWEALTGQDRERWRAHGQGWTVPASHLRYGEHPRDAVRRIAADILGLPGLQPGPVHCESDHDLHPRFPERGKHHDLWFLVEAALPADARVARPPWFAELAFQEPRRVLAQQGFARSHGDVVERWLQARAAAG